MVLRNVTIIFPDQEIGYQKGAILANFLTDIAFPKAV